MCGILDMTTIIMFSLSYKKSNHDLTSATKSDARETLADVTAFTGAQHVHSWWEKKEQQDISHKSDSLADVTAFTQAKHVHRWWDTLVGGTVAYYARTYVATRTWVVITRARNKQIR